ncbi:MAG: hypothetical protein ACYDA3_02190 [Gaiellaceae bacterium]
MKRGFVLLFVLALLGFALAGCGTSAGPTGGNGNTPVAVGTQGQDTNSQPAAGGLKNGSYTAAHNVCSLYPLAQLAQQNGLPATATSKEVATKISQGDADKKSAYRGCLDAINGK